MSHDLDDLIPAHRVLLKPQSPSSSIKELSPLQRQGSGLGLGPGLGLGQGVEEDDDEDDHDEGKFGAHNNDDDDDLPVDALVVEGGLSMSQDLYTRMSQMETDAWNEDKMWPELLASSGAGVGIGR